MQCAAHTKPQHIHALVDYKEAIGCARSKRSISGERLGGQLVMDPPKGGRRDTSAPKGSQVAPSRPGGSSGGAASISRDSPLTSQSLNLHGHGSPLRTSVRLNVLGGEEEFVSTGNATAAYRKQQRGSKDLGKGDQSQQAKGAPLRDAFARVKTLLPKNEADAKADAESKVDLDAVAAALEKVDMSAAIVAAI